MLSRIPANRISRCNFRYFHEIKTCEQFKPIQVTVVGAATDIGANLSLLLKHNCYITRLNLFDDDERVLGYGVELTRIPGGPIVACYAGNPQLNDAVTNSNLVVMVTRVARRLGYVRNFMLASNAPAVQRLCRAIAERNQNAFVAFSSNPVNALFPFAASILQSFNCYNPFKLFGITEIDSCRTRVLLSHTLRAGPDVFNVPIIGGHSDDAIIPLFSNLTPPMYVLDKCQADSLTRLVRKAGTDVLNKKKGVDTSTVAMAYSVNRFVSQIVDAIRGQSVVVNSFVANPHYGTRYFASPTVVGMHGISKNGYGYKMNDFEKSLLDKAVLSINRDIEFGENYVRMMQCLEKRLM